MLSVYKYVLLNCGDVKKSMFILIPVKSKKRNSKNLAQPPLFLQSNSCYKFWTIKCINNCDPSSWTEATRLSIDTLQRRAAASVRDSERSQEDVANQDLTGPESHVLFDLCLRH